MDGHINKLCKNSMADRIKIAGEPHLARGPVFAHACLFDGKLEDPTNLDHSFV